MLLRACNKIHSQLKIIRSQAKHLMGHKVDVMNIDYRLKGVSLVLLWIAMSCYGNANANATVTVNDMSSFCQIFGHIF